MPGSTVMRLTPIVWDARPVRFRHAPAMWPSSPRPIRTSSQCRTVSLIDGPPSHADHVTSECLAKPGDGSFAHITSFHPRPVLCLLQESAELVQKQLWHRAVATEPLDAAESFENGACLVHNADGTPRPVTGRRRDCAES